MEKKIETPRLRNGFFDGFVVVLGLAVLLIPALWPRFAAGAIALVWVGWRTRRKLAGEIDRLDSILNAIGAPVFVMDSRHRITRVNQAFCDFVGRPAKAVLGSTEAQLTPTAEATAMWMAGEEVLKSGSSAETEFTFGDVPGAARTALLFSTLFVERGGARNIVGVVRDITERKRAEEALARSEERFSLAVHGSDDGVLDWDIDAKKVYLSPGWKSMLGYTDDEVGDSEEEFLRRIHRDDRPRALAAQAAHLRGETPQFEAEVRMLHRDGSYRWMMSRGRVIRDASGRPIRMVGSQRDISEIKALEDRLRHDSTRDALTGLYNRRQFFELLKPAISTARRHGHPLAVCMADVDNYKHVNDLQGHAAGDEVLASIGRAIATEMRDADVAARYGGDEFCIFFPHTTAREAAVVLDRIRARIAKHDFFALTGIPFSVTMTMGVSELLDEDADSSALMKRADATLYEGKRAGRDRIVTDDAGQPSRRVLKLASAG